MEYYGGTLCISHTELTAGIMTEGNIKQLRHRGKLQQIRRGCYETPALFAVDSLPLKYRTEVYRRYPDMREQADSKPFMDTIEPDGEAILFYENYQLSDGRHLSTDKQKEYSNNCAIMNAFRRVIETSNSHRLRQSKPKLNKSEFWRKAAAALPRLADRFPHSLPESDRRLQNKFNEYMREGYICFISKKFQNKNSAKVDDDIKASVLVQLLGHHNNLDNAKIAEYYNTIAQEQGWKGITASAVGVWRDKYDLITAAGRLGASNFRNHKSMQIKRSRPTAPFLMWSLDGWEVEWLYQTTKTDSKGRSITTYTNRLVLEVVLDPCINYPIGYAIGTHENAELITAALRNAAKHSEELFGEMLRTNQIQCDHFAIKAMTPLYNVMSAQLTPARVKNAKTKPVEPYFNYLNETYCKRFNNWSGYGITTNPQRQPNSEALNKLRHSFPTEEELRERISQMITLDRQRKAEQFKAMMANLPSERRLPLSREQFLLNFGAETGHKNALEGGGLRPTLLGVKRDYDCFDIRFREHAGVRWTVKYDPENLSEVLAVNEDGSLRFMLAEKYVQPMALADRKKGDSEQLQKVYDYNKKLESHITERHALAQEKSAEVVKLNPILSRLLIADSNGQHKLHKAQNRLAASDIREIEVKAIEVPVVPHGASDIDDYKIF